MHLHVHAPRARRIGLLLSALLCGGLSAHPEDFDIVVYGATSGGITAAVQGAKMGKKVALISPAVRIGGLSSAGLGWTDLGDIKILGGLSRNFYHRLYLHYQSQPNWNSIRGMSGQGGQAFNSTYQTASIFEPKVAEQVFHDMLDENGVPVFQGRLDLDDGVIMDGLRITGIKMEDGKTYRGKMFIDASYEGDVMAGAGVTYTMGREANSVHGETISGVRTGGGHQITGTVSPYIVPGNPSSGLLPNVESTPIEPNGTGDHRFQAYCFRMCLTKAADRIPITQPEGYDPLDFEIVLRAVEAGQRTFFKEDKMPNGKTDSNNTGGVSCDFIGGNYGVRPDGTQWNWATLNHDERDALSKRHEYWQRGLVWTLQNHPRVLALVPGGIQPGWGLPADEFQDTGHWPYQLYVREARRMVSDYVMTQWNCERFVVAPDSVGMGAYTMDSHNVRRYISGGNLRNEGDVQDSIPGAYPISYRSIVPKVGECRNLFVPWCLSATHMAFGSIRMEPVFMALGQSSATAAAMAIDDNISVQEVPYAKLEMKLRSDGQSLTLSNNPPVTGIVVDNKDALVTPVSGWVSSTSVGGFIGTDYLSDNSEGRGTKSIRFTPDLPSASSYTVQLRWTSHDNRASNVPVKVFHKNGVHSTTVDQKEKGGEWVSLGSFQFDPGTAGYVLLETTNANGYVIGDAVQFTNTVTPPPTAAVTTFIPKVTRGSLPAGEFVFSRDGEVNNSLTIHFSVGGNASPGSYSPAFPASVTIAAGARETSLAWTAPRGAQPVGPKTLTLSLTPNSSYQIGNYGAATTTIIDPPFDAWRFSRFNSAQLANPSISGANADPDGNGADNLLEFFSGGKPGTFLSSENGRLYLHFQRHKDATGVPSRIWESTDLNQWSPSALPDLPALFEPSGDLRNIGLPLGNTPSGGGKKFYRLRVGE